MLFLRKALEIAKNTSQNIDVDHDIATVYHEIGFCYLNMDKHDEAKLWLEKALEIIKIISLDLAQDKCYEETLKIFVACNQDKNINRNNHEKVDVHVKPNTRHHNVQHHISFKSSENEVDW